MAVRLIQYFGRDIELFISPRKRGMDERDPFGYALSRKPSDANAERQFRGLLVELLKTFLDHYHRIGS